MPEVQVAIGPRDVNLILFEKSFKSYVYKPTPDEGGRYHLTQGRMSILPALLGLTSEELCRTPLSAWDA